MGLSLLERYIFRKAVVLLLTAAGALIGVVWVVRAVQQVDVVMTKGQGIWTYLQITTLGVPTLAAAIAPIALLIALVQVIKTLSADSELIVMSAAGASRKVLAKPFLAIGLITLLLVYFLHLWAGPTSMQVLRSHITKMRADLVSLVIREGAFRDLGNGMTFHVASRAPGGILKGIFILDGRDEKEIFSYLAEEGVISNIDGQTYLVLSDGQIQRVTADSDNVSIIKFNSYAYNLSTFSGKGKGGAASQMEVPTYNLFFPDKTDPFYQAKPGRYRSELHTRLTGGLYPIATVLILIAFLGLPRSNRQGQSIAITLAASSVVLLRVLGVVAEGLARKEPAAVYAVWALPLAGIVIPTLILASGRSITVPAAIQNSFDSAIERFASFWWRVVLWRPWRKNIVRAVS